MAMMMVAMVVVGDGDGDGDDDDDDDEETSRTRKSSVGGPACRQDASSCSVFSERDMRHVEIFAN
ncbi:hypothetical protein V1477_002277 [Vespula maculifrons]|uniref:Secreted protein n=1 Tax=Vespula maculifrons TaxID=7453 RepID=A0ABD2CW20_VESMC